MRSIIEKLWNGNIDPQNDRITNTPEMKQLIGYISRHHETLMKSLTDEQKDILSKLEACRDEYEDLAEKAVFVYAFRLGARIVAETLLPPIGEDGK